MVVAAQCHNQKGLGQQTPRLEAYPRAVLMENSRVLLRLSANGRFGGWAVFKESLVEVVTSFIPPAILLVLCHSWGSSPFNKQPSFNSPGSLSLQEGP